MSEFRFKLYVAGRTPRSESAIANLRRICEQVLHGRYELIVVDIVENPEVAEEERILTTPTLVKEAPPPLRRLTGDLSHTDRVLTGLALSPIAGLDAQEDEE